MTAYYNEIDTHAAQWLRNLIKAGHIAAGDVDERSIEDVRPDDLRGYTQCHFFAGVGVWSSALRLAGFADDRSVWTGSCPCQPFSQAGKGAGFADERHLWPAWHHLISECRPSIIFGEQVASKDVDPWIDLVFDDLEDLGYACAANPFPSAGVGAPHIRDRTFFVANANNARSQGRRRVRERAAKCIARARGVASIVADSGSERREGLDALLQPGRQVEAGSEVAGCGEVGRVADADSEQHDGRGIVGTGRRLEPTDHGGFERTESAGPTNGFWRDADWILCRDGKWRPVEPGTQPLAHGLAAGMGRLSAEQQRLASMAGLDAGSLKRAKAYRVVTLRGYGNAINREAAATFIAAADEAIKEAF